METGVHHISVVTAGGGKGVKARSTDMRQEQEEIDIFHDIRSSYGGSLRPGRPRRFRRVAVIKPLRRRLRMCAAPAI